MFLSKLKSSLSLSLFIITIILNFPNKILASINDISIKQRKEYSVNNFQNNIVNGNEYLLGAGDKIFIEFFGIKEYSRIYPIDLDGNVNIPEVNKYYAGGKSINEVTKDLNQIYKEFIIEPNIKIILVDYRPINAYIFGEVQNPGLYNFKHNKLSESTVIDKKIKQNIDSISAYPIKLFDALKAANGVTNYADLSEIEIIRINSETNGGGKIKTSINLLDLILSGDQSNNIRIFDGDSIYIPKSKNPIKEQIIAINKTNINPDEITVYISGNVEKSGPITLKKGSSLVQAIASSGGKKLWTGDVEFIRFNEFGISKKSRFKYNQKAKINTDSNPILTEGDIIDVKKTLLGKTSEIIGEFSNPILSGFGLFSIFN